MANEQHITVLLEEAVDALVQDPAGLYVDGTFGRGGHSARILERLDRGGQLLAIDKDLAAIATARARFDGDPRFAIAHASFAELAQLAEARQWRGKIAGVLLDLGVSSPQLDEPERGFSFQHDGPLDMRMDQSRGPSAAEWLNTAEEAEIERVLKDYGEERFARRIARALVLAREQAPIERTARLAQIVKAANPAWEKHKHPATRVFQGIRIFINNELADLEAVLAQALDVLAVGGRLVVISFHSLEDRLVKRFIRRQEHGDLLPRGLPVMESALNKRLRSVGKAYKVSADERDRNLRARSAVMRVAEKVG